MQVRSQIGRPPTRLTNQPVTAPKRQARAIAIAQATNKKQTFETMAQSGGGGSACTRVGINAYMAGCALPCLAPTLPDPRGHGSQRQGSRRGHAGVFEAWCAYGEPIPNRHSRRPFQASMAANRGTCGWQEWTTAGEGGHQCALRVANRLGVCDGLWGNRCASEQLAGLGAIHVLCCN